MLRFIAGISRATFLPLSLLCACLGSVCGLGAGKPIPLINIGLTLLAAVAAHASVNAFNEFADFRSGLDLHTVRTPFSGGSGALPAAPRYQSVALAWGVLTLLLVMVIGIHFLYLRGWALGVIGLVGVVLVVAYTPWINRYPWICLIAPGVGFGPVLVLGSSIAIGGVANAASIWLAVLMGVLVSGLLLANQQPDATVDALFGRRHLAIACGAGVARRVLGALWLSAPLILLLAVTIQGLPLVSLVALPALLLAVRNAWQLWKLDISDPLPSRLLASNVLVCLVSPLLLLIALACEAFR